jgi:hypothetical protein
MGRPRTKDDRYQKVCEDRGWVFVKCTRKDDNVTWITYVCSNGHEREVTSSNLLKARVGCGGCKNRKTKVARVKDAGTKKDKATNNISQWGGRLIEITGNQFRWICKNGHHRVSNVYGLANGHGCLICGRFGKRSNRKRVELGAIYGNLEVIEDLGVTKGHLEVRVRNVTNGLLGKMRLSDAKREKCKLLSEGQLKALLRKNGLDRKGIRNTKNSRFTVGDLEERLAKVKISLTCEDARETPLYDSSKRTWKAVCRCGREFLFKPNAVMCGQVTSCGCSKSGAQIQVQTFLESLGLLVDTNKRKLVNGFELDLLIPDKNLAIEYNGLYWHSDEMVGRGYHKDKMVACNEAGIRLVTIFEDEWLYRRPAVEGYLLAILGVSRDRVFARKTTLVDPGHAAIDDFIEKYHIQGRTTAGQYEKGLFYKGELVAAMVCRLSKNRTGKDDGEPQWELTRYCVKPGLMVVGGFEKLWKAFTEEKEPTHVISFSDNRWSQGDLYLRQGFELEHETLPSYSYFQKHDRIRYHKSLFQKFKIEKKFGPLLEGETEFQATSRLGYLRIWDCGLKKWVWYANKKGPEGPSSS